MAAYMSGESGNADNWLADRYAALQDNTRVPYSEANIASGLRWLARFKYPPSWGKDIVLPPVFAVAKEGASQAAKHITKEAEKEIKFMLPNPYEGLINEAVNRHISKNKNVN
jgi:hypothetical protein